MFLRSHEIAPQSPASNFQPIFSNTPQEPSQVSRVNALRARLSPLTPECRDKQGNKLRIWELRAGCFLGTVVTPEGKMTVLSQKQIINPCSHESSVPALLRIKEMQTFPFRLVFLENQQKMFVWPHMIAAGGDLLPYPFQEDSSTRGHVFRKAPGHLSEDSPVTRTFIRSATDFGGKTRWGTEWYFKTMPDGSQAWAQVRNGHIVNGGRNFYWHRQWVEDPNSESGGRLQWVSKPSSSSPVRLIEHQPSDGGSGPPKAPAEKQFQQTLQQTGLTDSYNATHRGNPVPEKGGTGGDIGGVASGAEYIEDLFDSPQSLLEFEHHFVLPQLEDGQVPFSDVELKQILRELAIGIYAHSTVPFFSLHFRQGEGANLFPVIHPAYENTLVGRVISMLDYWMKGYLNGGIFSEGFVDRWQEDPNWERRGDSALQELISLEEYCERHLEGNDKKYQSARSLEYQFHHHPLFGAKVQQLLTGESAGLSQFVGFKNSFRILSRQSSFQKEGAVFLIDSDFDVEYTIAPSPEYNKELEQHIRLHGVVPHSYQEMTVIYEIMAKLIHDHMVKLPFCKKYFAMLGVINFFSSYFSTMKRHHKIPVLPSLKNMYTKGCPSIFPHLPLTSFSKEPLKLNLQEAFREFLPKYKEELKSYLKGLAKWSIETESTNLSMYEPEKCKSLQVALAESIKDNILRQCSAPFRRVIKAEGDEGIHIIAENIALGVINQIIKVTNANVLDFSALDDMLNVYLKDFFENPKLKSVPQHLKEAYRKFFEENKDELKSYLKGLAKHLIVSSTENSMTYAPEQIKRLQAALAQCIQKNFPKHTSQQVESYKIQESGEKFSIAVFDDMVGDITFFMENSFDRIVDSIQEALSSERTLPNPENPEEELLFPYKTSVLPSELKENELERNKRVVGGCGMILETQKMLPFSPAASEIRYNNVMELLHLNPEVWKQVHISPDSRGWVFSLPFEVAPPSLSGDYSWMDDALLTSDDALLTSTDGNLFERLEQRSQILEAMFNGKKESFSELLEKTENLQSLKTQNGATLLHETAQVDDPFYFDELRKKDLSSREKDAFGFLPVHYAAMSGCCKTLTHILGIHDTYLNTKSKNSSTPLTLAVQHGQEQAVQLLLDKGAQPTVLANGYTDLHCALHEGNKVIIEALLNQSSIVSSQVNVCSEEGGTPLMLACELDDPSLVSRCIGKGAEASAKRKDGVTPIEIAVRRNCVPVLRTLLQHAAPSPLAIETAARESSLEVIKELAKTPGFDTFETSCQDSPLHIALRHANMPVAQFLTKYTGWYNKKNIEGLTPFQLAVFIGAWEIASTLYNGGAEADFESMLRVEYHPLLKRKFRGFSAEILRKCLRIR